MVELPMKIVFVSLVMLVVTLLALPFVALPYGLVCLQAARKIDRLTQGHKE
jgi:hypothetical protein